MPELRIPEDLMFVNTVSDMTNDQLMEAWHKADLANNENELAIIEGAAVGKLGGDFRQQYAARYPDQTRYELLKRA